MTKKDYPKTNAIRCLEQHGIPFEVFTYAYEERGGTRVSSEQLGVDEHSVVKTLVMETDAKEPLIVLMHGDREVSTKQLARFLGVKSVAACDPKVADRHSGYQVGGTSPFGTRTRLPVFVQKSVLSLSTIYLNGGKRGFAMEILPDALLELPEVIEAEIAVPV